MSVIIRLQNLPWSANASDVRGFFRGLGIPDGGVHIVGGENGDAFIAFSTDEDARQAMMLNGSKLKETQVSLLLSSRAEMQKVIETARQQTISFMNFSAQQPSVAAPVLPTIAPQISMPGIQTQSSILNGSNSVVGLMDPQQLTAAKPQPPIITSSSLSGILAQQMLQQHQIQLIRQQQNMPVLTSTSVRHDTYKSMNNQYNAMGNQYSDNSLDANGKNMQGNDSKRSRMSRSRSRSRDRRDRKRSRSRSRDRSRRYRDRSRSRERRRRRRSPSSDRQSRDRRDRNSRDSVRKDRSYDKDARPSLDRNKSVDGSNTNFNSSMENNLTGNAADQQKSLNYPDAIASNKNFNNPSNDGSKATFNNFNSQSRNDYPANIMNDFDPTTAMVPFNDTNNSNNIGSCIRVTNMNHRTHYAAIRKFFYGLQIPNDGIKLLNDENGKRRNDVVIRFARPDIARDALALDGNMLNGNSVRVLSISDVEYESEVDSFQPPGRNQGRFGDRYDDRNRGRSEENSRDNNYGRRNNRDYHDRGYHRSRFNDDSDGHGNHSNDGRDRRDDDDDVMLITDSNDGETMPVGLTLLIEDLPPFAKEQDIIKMFSDFTLMDVMLAKVNKAFRAYVKFHSQTDAEAALKQTHLHRIDFKTVFVSPCSEATYDKAKQEYDGFGDTTMSKPEKNLTISEPPNPISRDDPHQNYNDQDEFRNDSSQADNEVDQFGRSIRNRKFVNQQQQHQQQQQPPATSDNKSQIPSLFNLTFDPPFIATQQQQQQQQTEPKFVPADPRLRRQFDQNNSQSPDSQLSPNNQQSKTFNPFNPQSRIDPRLQRNLPNLTNSTNTKIVFIGNVEYNTTEGDIVSFFSDIGAIPNGVFFVKNARGQPCGDCFVRFLSADDASKALIKNRFRFRTRVIRVSLAEPDEAEKALGFSLIDGSTEPAANANDSVNETKSMATDENSSSEKNDKEIGMDDGQNAERDGDDDQTDDDNNGDNGSRFDRGGRRGDPRMYNGSYSRSGGNDSDRSGNMTNNSYRGGRGGGSDNHRGRGSYNQNNVQRNLDGCIVSLSNVPFAATPRDIADFFGEYNLGPNDIIRRYNDDGSLTGEARVRFLTPTDASEAIERHNRERIRNRVIHLRLFT